MIESTKIQEEQSDPFEGMSDEEVADLLEIFMEDVTEKNDLLNNLILELEEEPESTPILNEIFQNLHNLKGTSGTFGFQSLGRLFHDIESLLDNVRQKKMLVTQELTNLLLQCNDNFKLIINRIKSRRPSEEFELKIRELLAAFGIKKADVPTVAPVKKKEALERFKEEAEEYIRLKTRKIDTVIALSSELNQRKRFDNIHLEKLITLKGLFEQLKSQTETSLPAQQGSRNNGDQIESTFDKLELTLDVLKTELEFWSESSARILDELQYEILQARMVDINSFFKQLNRTVRDLSKERNKKIRFAITGIDTEIDRKVMEEIKDPILHIVRNAVDHGIEIPELRKSMGKKEEALLKISATPSGNEITIEIEDDGAGINFEKVAAKAVKSGIASVDEVNAMSSQEKLDLLFRPGFSTKETTDQLSGRGVGLDVVKTNIEKVRGFVSIETKQNIGTKFRLKIPTTLSSFPALLLRSGVYYFYFHIISVKRVIRIEKDQIPADKKFSSVIIDGLTIPQVSLADKFNLVPDPERTGLYLIILQSGKSMIALEVDECLDQHDIVLKPPPELMRNIPTFSGVTLLPDGGLAYALESAEIFAGLNSMQLSKGNSWNLDELHTEEESFGIVVNEDAVEEIKLTEYLNINVQKKNYGIPLGEIKHIADLRDDAIFKKLQKDYTLFVTIQNDEIVVQKKADLKNPLIYERWRSKGKAVMLDFSGEIALIVPDYISEVVKIEQGSAQLLHYLEPQAGKLPGLVILEES